MIWQVTALLFLWVVAVLYARHWLAMWRRERQREHESTERLAQLEFWQCLHRQAHRRLSQASLHRDAKALNAAIRECNLYHRRFCELAGREPSVIPTVPE